MKNIIKRGLAALTATVIIASSAVWCFAAIYATLYVKDSSASRISYSGINLVRHTGVFNSKTERVYTVTAKPNAYTKFRVTSGGSVYGRSAVSRKVSSFNAGQNKRVAAAINADFFASSTGIPLGIQISDGVIQATNNSAYDRSQNRYSIGFREDGSAVIGIPEIKLSVTIGGITVTPDRVNSFPSANLVLITPDYADKAYWSMDYAHDLIAFKVDGALRANTPISGMFIGYYTNLTQPYPLSDGYMYLVAPRGDSRLRSIEDGRMDGVVSVLAETSADWASVTDAVGGGNLLINNGTLRYTSTYDGDISGSFTSRSAIGVKADGSVMFYAAERDSRGEKSAGMPISAVAQSMYNLGCVYAINFDGGGSTTLLASEGGGACAVENSCQDGAERAVANCVMLVCEEVPPVVLEDFEELPGIYERYDGLSLISAGKGEAFTGGASLKADYKFAGDTDTLALDFEKPIDVGGYSNVTLSVMGGDGIKLYAVFQKGKVSREITLAGDWRQQEIDLSGATELSGFKLVYDGKRPLAGSVMIDRIVSYAGYSLTDVAAPKMAVTASGTRLNVSWDDGAFSSGSDTSSIVCRVDDKTFTPSGGVIDLSSIKGGGMRRAVIEMTDLFGNRARMTRVVAPSDYNAPLPYDDMREGGWDAPYIRYCTEAGIVNGFEQNGQKLFSGGVKISRAQFCTMLVRYRGLDPNAYAGVSLPYEDLSSIPRWALLYVKAAYAEGIMTGSKTYTGLAFLADDEITRQEAACAIDRITAKDGRLRMNRRYTDADQISAWAAQSVSTLTSAGVFDGDTDGRFYPKRSLSRSEAAAIITRIM